MFFLSGEVYMQQAESNSTKTKQIAAYTDKADDKALILLMNTSMSGWMDLVIFIGLLTNTSGYCV